MSAMQGCVLPIALPILQTATELARTLEVISSTAEHAQINAQAVKSVAQAHASPAVPLPRWLSAMGFVSIFRQTTATVEIVRTTVLRAWSASQGNVQPFARRDSRIAAEAAKTLMQMRRIAGPVAIIVLKTSGAQQGLVRMSHVPTL